MGRACRSVLLVLVLVAALTAAWAEAVPGVAQGHFDAGMTAKRAGDLERAAREFEWALSLAPDWAEAHWALAWTWAGLGEDAKARYEFSRVTVLAPNSAMAQKAQRELDRLKLGAAAPGGTTPEAPLAQVTHNPPGIAWHETWDDALAAAKASGRPILASVYTQGAAPAATFAEKTLPAPEVGEAAREFECVRLDASKGLPWPELGEAPDPTPVIICRPDGSPTYATFGVLEPGKLVYHLQEAKRYLKMEADAPALEARHVSSPGDIETRFELGRWYLMTGGADLGGMLQALGGPGAGLPTQTVAQPGQTEPVALAGGLWVGFERDKEKAAELRAKGAVLLDEVRAKDPADESHHAGDMDLLLMQSAFMDDKMDEAVEMARAYVEKYPEGEGGVLSYLIQAFASLGTQPQQSVGAAPDLTEAKALLDKGLTAPGPDGARAVVAMFRMVLELIEGMIQAMQGLGDAAQPAGQ